MVGNHIGVSRFKEQSQFCIHMGFNFMKSFKSLAFSCHESFSEAAVLCYKGAFLFLCWASFPITSCAHRLWRPSLLMKLLAYPGGAHFFVHIRYELDVFIRPIPVCGPRLVSAVVQVLRSAFLWQGRNSLEDPYVILIFNLPFRLSSTVPRR